jgi:hypothetical protein
MKEKGISFILKGVLGMIAVVLISFGYLDSAKANTVTAYADDNTTVAKAAGTEALDINTVMAVLEGKDLKNGETYQINEDYEAQITITVESSKASGIQLMSSTNSYVATCYINIMHLGTNTHVATITHTVSITTNDSGLVHINSGSLSVSPVVSYVSGYAYGYSITNTDGTYSYATGMVRLYDSSTGYYSYIGCGVSICQGGSPSFTFSPV